MLELRPNCECCDKDLPPESQGAMICSFECTFCVECTENVLGNKCPNCGGNFVHRPIRPSALLKSNPPSTKRVLKEKGCVGLNVRKRPVIDVYLFDWGNTLMVDIPGAPGKMCDWDVVEAVEGAKETLQFLSQTAQIYIATGAADSKEQDIEKALDRVGLSRFISGYFCEANLGVPKGSPGYLPAIFNILKIPKERVAMVGDSLAKDIEPAIAFGIKPIWVSEVTDHNGPENIRHIRSLLELCI